MGSAAGDETTVEIDVLLLRFSTLLGSKEERKNEPEEIALAYSISAFYGQQADFSADEQSKVQHQGILQTLMMKKICNSSWLEDNPSLQVVCAFIQVARILLRDRELQDQLFDWHFSLEFAQFGEFAVQRYFGCSSTTEEAADGTAVIRGFLSICQKLCNSQEHAVVLAESGFHKTVLRLLTARDMVVVQATLQFLALLSEPSDKARSDLCSTNAIDQCVQLLKDSDLLSQKLMSTKNVRLQWHLAWLLTHLAEDEEIATEMGQLGAIPLMLSELRLSSSDITENKNRNLDDWLTMLNGLTAVLAQLCNVDLNAQLIVQDNGIYVLCRTLLAQLDYPMWYKNRNYYLLQCSVFRVLRLLFSLERNRQFFKRLFPSEFFEKFIDIGHYILELNAYEQLVQDFHQILEVSGADIQQLVALINQRRAPLSQIGNYAVLEQLGAGAFGCVYKVKKHSSASASGHSSDTEQLFALKEIFMHQTTLEKEAKDKSFGDIISEVKIIRQQLRHPNIVRYRRVFAENEKMYIVMDLIDGASLKEHICSVKEKRTNFSEERIWNILIQMVLALRYLHKEKHIIHRDLKPNNVMLADNDRVVITDFGLAKQREESYLKSTAGTILYSCPEILQNEPYGEKSDIWSFGCIVYEMCTLHPPFFSQNMLQLASAIVEARYEPVSRELYSANLEKLISNCLTVSPSERTDVIGVAEMMSDHLLQYIDGVRHHQKILLKAAVHQQKGMKDVEVGGGSSLSASGTSFTSSGSGMFPVVVDSSDGSAALANRFTTTRSSSVEVTNGDEEEKRTRNLSQESRPMKAINRPRAAAVKSAEKSSNNASRIPRCRSLSSRRIRRTMSANALPVIDTSSQQFPAGGVTEKGGKKFAWHDQKGSEPLVLPTIRRANSSSIVDRQRRNEPLRVQSAGSTISISSAKLRQITDPILELLAVLHRVMFVFVQPPSDSVNHKRRVVEHFARALFTGDSTPLKIKAELRKLSNQSTDIVSVNLGYSDFRPVLQGIPFDVLNEHSKDMKVKFLTYEQLYACLEAIFTEKEVCVNWDYRRPPSRLLTPRVGSP